jgi:hypothetical protein
MENDTLDLVIVPDSRDFQLFYNDIAFRVNQPTDDHLGDGILSGLFVSKTYSKIISQQSMPSAIFLQCLRLKHI